MTVVRPKSLAHIGRHPVEGFLVHAALLTDDAVRARVLEIWRPGVRVYRAPGGLLVLLGQTARLRDPWIGTPIVRCHGVLSAVPLTESEVETLRAPVGSIVFASKGAAGSWIRSANDEIDPASWLSTELCTTELTDLGAPPVPVIGPPAAVEVVDRQVFQVGEEHEGVAEVLDAMEKMERREAILEQLPVGKEPGWLDRAIASAVAWLRRPPAPAPDGSGPQSAYGEGSTAGRSTAGSLPALPEPSGPSLWERLASWLERMAAIAAVESGLGRMIGDRQAEYLDKLLEEFERGDVAEALRRAIPLRGESTGKSHPMLRMPTPRESLAPNLGPRADGGGGTLLTQTSLYETLRKTYESAAEALIEEGRYEEAAFVYADLLGDIQRAVSMLEKFEKYELAAKLAEARDLDIAWIIKLYWLAGDIDRAVWLARTHMAFADVLRRLTDPEQSDRLRMIWAAILADAGQYAAAVGVIWPVVHARPSARKWVERAVALGGPAGSKMLANQLNYFPDTWPTVRKKALELLIRRSAAKRSERQAFAQALSMLPATPQTQTLARAALRATVRDSTDVPGLGNLLRNLITASGESALDADLPPAGRPVVNTGPAPTWPAHDIGLSRAHDAIRLPGGDLVVAMGESGIARFSADGREVAHFDNPATALVCDRDGSRAIGLIERDDHMAICRLDLVTNQAEHWTEAPLRTWCEQFDGDRWFVAIAHRQGPCDVVAIDARADDWRALWQLREAGEVQIMRVVDDQLQAVLFTDGEDQEWTWGLDGMRLRRREPGFPIWSVDGWQFMIDTVGHDTTVAILQGEAPRHMLTFEGALSLSVRLEADGRFVLCDDRGRVAVYDAASNVVWADIRV